MPSPSSRAPTASINSAASFLKLSTTSYALATARIPPPSSEDGANLPRKCATGSSGTPASGSPRSPTSSKRAPPPPLGRKFSAPSTSSRMICSAPPSPSSYWNSLNLRSRAPLSSASASSPRTAQKKPIATSTKPHAATSTASSPPAPSCAAPSSKKLSSRSSRRSSPAWSAPATATPPPWQPAPRGQ